MWSRGEDLLNGRFPELDAMHAQLPDHTVLDGEIVVWRDGRVQPFADLQKRIGRKTVTKKILADLPVAFLAYDLLEADGEDIRAWPQWKRRERLEAVVAEASHDANGPLQISPLVDAPDWPALAVLRAESRARGVEGFMLKQRESRYGAGRTKDVGTWWKWKIDPYSIDAVLIYAQSGHGRRAKPLHGLHLRGVGRRRAAQAGAVRQGLLGAHRRGDAPGRPAHPPDHHREVRPGAQRHADAGRGAGIRGHPGRPPRHKSGIAVRFPRMLRLRWDKPIDEADSLSALQGFIAESLALKQPA